MSRPIMSRDAWLTSIRSRIEPVGECMEWQGYFYNGKTPMVFCPENYPWQGSCKGNQSVRSVLYALSTGERLPASTVIRPRCWNERCVHEDHFQLFTRKQQSREQSKRGELQTVKAWLSTVRKSRARAKLTDEQVHDIRTSTDSTTAAAKRHGVWPQTINEIRRNRLRRDVLPAASVFGWARAA